MKTSTEESRLAFPAFLGVLSAMVLVAVWLVIGFELRIFGALAAQGASSEDFPWEVCHYVTPVVAGWSWRPESDWLQHCREPRSSGVRGRGGDSLAHRLCDLVQIKTKCCGGRKMIETYYRKSLFWTLSGMSLQILGSIVFGIAMDMSWVGEGTRLIAALVQIIVISMVIVGLAYYDSPSALKGQG